MTDNGSPTDASADQSAEKFPLRLRVHALARTLGLTSKQVLGHLEEMGVTARTAQSSISRADAHAVELRLAGDGGEAAAETPDQDAAPAAPQASLFSAVEPVEPVASAQAEATAPLFLSASAPADKKAAKKAAGSKSAAKKSAGKSAAAKSDDTPTDAAEQSNDSSAGDAKDAGTKDSGTKAEKNGKKNGKKSGGKKSGKKAKADDSAAEAESVATDEKPEAIEAESAAAPAEAVEQTPVAADAPVEQTADAEPATDSTTSDAGDSDNSDSDNGDSDNGDSDNETATDEQGESRSRRRRRGRRGRGRGRGDQGADGEPDSTSPDSTSTDSTSTDSSDDETASTDSHGDQASDQSDSESDSAAAGDQNAQSGDAEEASADDTDADAADDDASVPSSKRRRRRRRRRAGSDSDEAASTDDPPNTVVHEREPRTKRVRDEVQGISGSTRLEAKRQRRRDGRDAGRRRPPILTESEFLARRESVERVMVVRERAAHSAVTSAEPHAAPTEDYTQIAVLEDGVLVEHFVTTETSQSMVGNIYLGRVQNVLPGMEAAFVDIGRGRNGVLYAGEVNWEAAGLDGGSRKIEQALKPGDHVLVQVSKDPIGHKGARLTTQISLAGRYLVYVPGGTSTGISRKLPDTERRRLKQILAKLVPAEAGVIVRTASEGVSAEDLGSDIERLEAQWKSIEAAAEEHKAKAAGTTKALYEEPDLLVRVVRDIFNEDFRKLVIEGDRAWAQVSGYVGDVAPDLAERLEQFVKDHSNAPDSFAVHRIDEQLAKALDRKVWLPSGGTLIIEHTEAMTVVDVNTGKFTGSGGNLEETVTRNNLEAAEEIVRQMRLRDIGGMIIVDFIDMVLESNRDLVLRRLTEALARDRTRHQVSEVTSLGLVQMTRKRLGTGLLEAFSTTCTACSGRGVIVHTNPVEVRAPEDANRGGGGDTSSRRSRRSRRRGGESQSGQQSSDTQQSDEQSQQQSGAQHAKAAHKPAAEHPMFRAMAHPEEHGEAEQPAGETTASTPASGKVAAVVEQVTVTETETVAVEEATAETAPTPKVGNPEAERGDNVKAETAKAETGQPQPGVVTRQRRRAVRRAAAPTTAPEPVETAAPATPVTSVAAQSSEPIVAVKRSARRRSGRRSAGAPPSGE
ncbi:translation initiation factor IF-2 N-terminal domain-containing protein [Gordonia sp. (in: high G+C Gram-positive bacteria)]|uniref:translation initiation factor IF-2 N-terminal domain-containing protein n=1 Tax=Gordonia sp. (in: high G+C Gram-positive bacteria) TaxID=84139 RepID=UPI0016BA814C|nr:translation initiation factor IF-2 N-terminal domain-containing protein [Gordonia sp. (in: high G+C Gram-positive bacteria)]NLG45868.1 Rne/Rng family ribonuclease [Gordonia sp. (in: high G+C Gram-positive bacteria)]